MRDPRIDQFAKQIITYSTKVKPGEAALIEYQGRDARELAVACAEQTILAGGTPIVQEANDQLSAFFLNNCNEQQMERKGDILLKQMKECQVYVGIRGSENIFGMKGVSEEALEWHSKYIKIPVHMNQRVKKSRWVVMRYPNASMAQLAERSTPEFADFYFRACCLDYAKMETAVKPLQKLMDDSKKVHITGPQTELRFSIEGIKSIPCTGQVNIPDGECFTAPVRDSVEGTVFFNCKTTHRTTGEAFSTIHLTFEKGKVVKVETGDAEKNATLNKILDKDEGARYLGEFAIGFHPFITEPMNDILFDEKIKGSFHMALGACYDEASNGNKSAEHWDLVQIQRPEYGGGEIYFDDVLIRKDGEFVIDELKGLNAENFQDL
jgi:aminopeptidase